MQIYDYACEGSASIVALVDTKNNRYALVTAEIEKQIAAGSTTLEVPADDWLPGLPACQIKHVTGVIYDAKETEVTQDANADATDRNDHENAPERDGNTNNTTNTTTKRSGRKPYNSR